MTILQLMPIYMWGDSSGTGASPNILLGTFIGLNICVLIYPTYCWVYNRLKGNRIGFFEESVYSDIPSISMFKFFFTALTLSEIVIGICVGIIYLLNKINPAGA